MIVAVVGLTREARIVEGARVATVIGGGDAASLRRQLLARLAKPDISGIISIGLAGGLSTDVRPGSIVAGSAVIAGKAEYKTDIHWRERLLRAIPNSRPGVIAGSDTVISHRPEKTELYERTGAIVVDMESHVAASLAQERNVPFAVLRVVCDPADRTLPPAAMVAMKPDGSVDTKAVLRSVLGTPQQALSLAYLARDSRVAFRALLRCRNFLGDSLGGPNFS